MKISQALALESDVLDRMIDRIGETCSNQIARIIMNDYANLKPARQDAIRVKGWLDDPEIFTYDQYYAAQKLNEAFIDELDEDWLAATDAEDHRDILFHAYGYVTCINKYVK